MEKCTLKQAIPDRTGHFGEFGGRYVPETLMPALLELEEAYMSIKDDSEFQAEFDYYLRQYAGRPNPLYYADRLTEELGGAKIYLKRLEKVRFDISENARLEPSRGRCQLSVLFTSMTGRV